MGPSLSINADRAAQFRQNREDPLSLENMTEAVTLMPCGHTFDEPSIHNIPGFGGLEAPEPCEQGTYHITKVRIVNRINCPICRVPAREYYRNWAMRDVCQEIPELFGEEKKAAPARRAVPNPAGVPAPRKTFKERFDSIVNTFFGGCISLGVIGFFMDLKNDNDALRAQIQAGQAREKVLQGAITLVIITAFVCALFSSKK